MPVDTTKKTDYERQITSVWLIDPETGLPVGGLDSPARMRLPAWHYIGGEYWVNPNNQALGVPADCTIIEIDAEDAECYYQINGLSASSSSYGYVPSEGGRIIGPLDNITGLRIHGTSSKVHITYFREA